MGKPLAPKENELYQRPMRFCTIFGIQSASLTLRVLVMNTGRTYRISSRFS